MGYGLFSRVPAFALATMLLLAVMATMWVFLPNVAAASSITVDTAADDITFNGNCTLREAIIAANTLAGTRSIAVPADTNIPSIVSTSGGR